MKRYFNKYVQYRRYRAVNMVIKTEYIPSCVARRYLRTKRTETLKVRERVCSLVCKQHYLQQTDIQPFEDLCIIKLSVCGSHRRLQNSSQVVLVQSGGRTHQLWPANEASGYLRGEEADVYLWEVRVGCANLSRSMRCLIKSPWPSSRYLLMACKCSSSR